MRNNTFNFIQIVNTVLEENKEYFSILEKTKIDNIQKFKINILDDFQISYEKTYFDLNKIFQNHIKEFILNREKDFSMNTKHLTNISTQIEIDYLLKKLSKDEAQFYHSISSALIHYGIYRNNKIVPFRDISFWKELIKKLTILSMMNPNQYSNCCNDDDYTKNHPDFNQLHRLIKTKKHIEEKLNEELEVIDTVVIFKKGQEERIVRKIEKKLSQLHLFNFLRFIFNIYEYDKKNFDTMTIPFKYIINILIKNISFSKHKNNDPKKFSNNIDLLSSFISLYQLKENKFEAMNITEHSLVEHLKKQVIYTNFYPLYALKTNTLIEYIENIIQPSIQKKLFFDNFGFNIKDLINFFQLMDRQKDNIIGFKQDNIQNHELKILELFSINANEINKNYLTINTLEHTRNIFTMNPVIKYKNEFYIIGFKYFKMNFYNTLVEKIRKKIDKNINHKLGTSVDKFVEDIFTKIKDKHNYEIFSGHYKPPKKENPESDLMIKTDKDIIFIENKNKYLTHHSFSGSDSNILKDLVLSLAFSQKQLFKHERNLKNYKKIKFNEDKKELIYENQNIVKISISTNNWFNIMNNIPQTLLLSLIRLRFEIKEDKKHDNKDDFIKANNYLDDLQAIISELYQNQEFDMKVVLNQTLFLPLELIVEKYKDDNFIECLKSLVGMKMNTDNILYIYDYCQYLNTHNKT